MTSYSYKFILSYEGTVFHGWQKNRVNHSIQFAFEKAMQAITLSFVKIEGASRTDAGVHAKGQVVRVDFTKPLSDLKRALVGINSKLPEDIKVISIEPCSSSFHPTLDAKQKVYEYQICLGPAQHPCHRRFSWHVHYDLDINVMKEASILLARKQNFKSLTNRKKNETYVCFERDVRSIEIIEIEQDRIKIVVQGNSFMYKMVRNLVGMLVQIARGKTSLTDLENILKSCDRRLAPLTAPAHGLCLLRIDY